MSQSGDPKARFEQQAAQYEQSAWAPEITPIRSKPPPVPEEAMARVSNPRKKVDSMPVMPAKSDTPWFETFFSDDYLRTVREPAPKVVTHECDFIEEVFSLQEGSTVLDLGCGLGKHAIELTARGYSVVGVDLSLPMLSRAADEAQERGLRINFLHSDMRDMSFDGAFDGVLCWGTTFGYFEDPTNQEIAEKIRRALKPGGRLVLDVANRDHVLQSQPNLVWFEGDGCVCLEETQFNYFTSRLEVRREVILDNGAKYETKYSLRLYSLHELGQLLHRAGFRVTQVTGRQATPGTFFGVHSPRLIIQAERRLQDRESLLSPSK